MNVPDVISEMLLPGEGFGAEGAFVRRLSGVQVHVVGEVLLARERLGAVRALERGLARVLPADKRYSNYKEEKDDGCRWATQRNDKRDTSSISSVQTMQGLVHKFYYIAVFV